MVGRLDGGVDVYVGSSAIGQGVETIMAQIAADALGLPMERVTVMHGSTSYLRDGFGSYGSRGTVMGGSAIVVAAKAFLDALGAAAAHWLSVAADEITITDGVARTADGRSVSLGQVAAEAGLWVDSRPRKAGASTASNVRGRVARSDHRTTDVTRGRPRQS